MTLSKKEQVQLKMLLKLGDESGAIRYLEQELNMSTSEATQAVEKLKPSVKPLPRELIQDFKARKLTKDSKKEPAFGFIFMIIGIGIIGFSGYLTYSNYQFMQDAIAISGEVVELETHYSSNDDGGSTLMYTPVFEYEYNGELYTHHSNTSSSSRSYEIGETVEIYIKAESPGEALVNSFMERWLFVVIIGCFGAMFLGVGYLVFRIF